MVVQRVRRVDQLTCRAGGAAVGYLRPVTERPGLTIAGHFSSWSRPASAVSSAVA